MNLSRDLQMTAGGAPSAGPADPKGQLISECLFDLFKFSKKTNEKFDKFLPQNLNIVL